MCLSAKNGNFLPTARQHGDVKKTDMENNTKGGI